MGDVNVVLPCVNTMSLAHPGRLKALIVRFTKCAIASSPGAQMQISQQLAPRTSEQTLDASTDSSACQAEG